MQNRMSGDESAKLTSLTPRQREIFEFLKDLILNRGYGPTVREIGNEFGIKSPNGVMCHLKALEKKGLITRESHMSRAIELCDKPERATSVSMLGTFSAGKPFQGAAGGETEDFMDVLGSGDHVCVKVGDDSVAKDGLMTGDFLLVRKQGSARDGDKVLVLIDGQNAVLGVYCTDAKGVRLEPLSGKGRAVVKSEVIVLGIIVGVVRKL